MLTKKVNIAGWPEHGIETFPHLAVKCFGFSNLFSFVVCFSDNQVFPWQPFMDEQVEVVCCDSGLMPARAFSSVYKALPIQTAYNALSVPCFSLGKTLGYIFRRPCERELAVTSCPHEVQLSHQLHLYKYFSFSMSPGKL